MKGRHNENSKLLKKLNYIQEKGANKAILFLKNSEVKFLQKNNFVVKPYLYSIEVINISKVKKTFPALYCLLNYSEKKGKYRVSCYLSEYEKLTLQSSGIPYRVLKYVIFFN